VSTTFIDRPSTLAAESTPAPRAIVAGGEAIDLSTHADLGIAYKEMGLYDAAINEFKQLTHDPRREVFALTMMGECYEAKGSLTEAVLRYKRALNCDQVTETENLDLYFLLGGAFERLGDVGEALYFFEKVMKRDPKFRDADQKVAALRPRLARRA
jgi:tetratricopeptide (TPR) repeat protein